MNSKVSLKASICLQIVLQGCLLPPELFSLFHIAVSLIPGGNNLRHALGGFYDRHYIEDIGEMAETPEDIQAASNEVLEATNSLE